MSITPFLWFEHQAEEAVNFYVSVFPRSKVTSVMRVQGKAMSAECELDGQKLMALNGNPQPKFSESVSFFVGCETQPEIDHLWDKLTADGGEPGRCGWLKDKFGVSWQIIPKSLSKMLGGGDPATSQRVITAMLRMNKLDVKVLQQAYDGQ